MERIKVGQIGIGHNHAEGKMLAVQRHPELFEVTGYTEEEEAWLEKRGSLPCYQNIPRLREEELLERSDLILVECDVRDLTRTAERCVDAGKHIHMDKPASGSLTEFRQFLDKAKEKKLVVQMGYMYRYNPAIQKCVEIIQSGGIGEVYEIDAEMSTKHSDQYREWLKQFQGGAMYIFGAHLIDLIVAVLGMPQKVHPYIRQTGLKGIYADDNTLVVLEYEKALVKVAVSSTKINGWGMRRFAVSGSRGTIEIRPIEGNTRMTVSTEEIAQNPYADLCEEIRVPVVSANARYDEMVRDLYLFVRGQKENPYSYAHDLNVQKVLYEIIGIGDGRENR